MCCLYSFLVALTAQQRQIGQAGRGVKIWLEYLLRIIRPWEGQFKTSAGRFDLVVRACEFRAYVVLFLSPAHAFSCSVVCSL